MNEAPKKRDKSDTARIAYTQTSRIHGSSLDSRRIVSILVCGAFLGSTTVISCNPSIDVRSVARTPVSDHVVTRWRSRSRSRRRQRGGREETGENYLVEFVNGFSYITVYDLTHIVCDNKYFNYCSGASSSFASCSSLEETRKRFRVWEIYERFVGAWRAQSDTRCNIYAIIDLKEPIVRSGSRIFCIRAYLQSINRLVAGFDGQVTLAVLNRSQCVAAHVM